MPKQCLSCRLEVLVNFEEVCAQSFGAFIVDFEYFCLLQMHLNAILWHIFVAHRIDVTFFEFFKNISLQLRQ